jgi:hypothetical protein
MDKEEAIEKLRQLLTNSSMLTRYAVSITGYDTEISITANKYRHREDEIQFFLWGNKIAVFPSDLVQNIVSECCVPFNITDMGDRLIK